MPLLLLLSHSVVSSFATPWTVAHQAPLSMGFPRQEYWSGLPFPSPGDLPHPGIKLRSPSLASRFFTTTPPGKPFNFLPLIKFSLSANCTPTLQPTQTCIHTHTYTHTHTHSSLNHQKKCPGSNQIMISHLVLGSWPQSLCF